MRFYMNLGIYSGRYEEVVKGMKTDLPKLLDCQINIRAESATGSLYTHYDMEEWGSAQLTLRIVEEMEKAEAFFATLKNADQIADYLLLRKGINYGLFRYFLTKSQHGKARLAFVQVRDVFGEEERWKRILPNYQKIADEFECSLS